MKNGKSELVVARGARAEWRPRCHAARMSLLDEHHALPPPSSEPDTTSRCDSDRDAKGNPSTSTSDNGAVSSSTSGKGAAATLCSAEGAASTFISGSGFYIELLRLPTKTSQPPPRSGDVVELHYACLLAASRCCVDASRSKPATSRAPLTFTVGAGEVVAGLDLAVRQLELGALARVHVPPRLGYGERAAGPIPPNSNLIFEVELLRVNESTSSPLPARRARRLLLLPLRALPPSHAASDGAAIVLVHPEAADAGGGGGGGSGCPGDGDSTSDEASTDDEAGSVAQRAATDAPWLEPPWVSRLRPPVPPPAPECASFVALYESRLGSDGAVVRAAASYDGGASLVVGASPIKRAGYGVPWDSATPLVLTGARTYDFAPSSWGWRWLVRERGDDLVLAKSRAPIFPGEAHDRSLIAECSVREYVRYARRTPVAAATTGSTPMYMNGWDVFEQHPHLWDASVAEIPGTIRNLSAQAHEVMRRRLRINADLTPQMRQLCKLFVGCRGAITRIHADNHEAHAWLTQLRGYKLYVLCAPTDEPFAPGGERVDPLDGGSAARAGVGLFATILRPGETILVPSGWWHYAASLSPTMTLMCNFWDSHNFGAVIDLYYEKAARALEQTRQRSIVRAAAGDGPQPPWAAAPEASATVEHAPRRYRVSHAPFVYVRNAPSTLAPMLGIVRAGREIVVEATRAGWVRLRREPAARAAAASGTASSEPSPGWLLIDGKALGLGPLLEPLQ